MGEHQAFAQRRADVIDEFERGRAGAVRFGACAGSEPLQWQPAKPSRIPREDCCMQIAHW
jgi:hypothetical protein